MAEGSNKPLVLRPVLVERQRVAVTVEGAAKNSPLGYTHVLTRRDVSSKNSIYVVLVHGFIHHHSKLMPVGGITDHDRRCEFTGGMAVGERISDVQGV